MSFIDERVNVITSDSILGRSMYRVNARLHDELAQQMKQWEKRNKVTIVPIGVSAEFNPLRPDSKRYEDNINKTSISKHQNLISVGNGKIGVKVGTFRFGKFDTIKEALIARDDYRAKNNMKPAEY